MSLQFREGKTGRVFFLKVEHGEDLLAEIRKFVTEKQVEAGVMFLLGGLGGASMVVGPREKGVPPDPQWRSFEDDRELLGTGTVFWGDDGPMIHLHASVGRGDGVLTGCIREKAVVYLVGEVILMEVLGTGAVRRWDSLLGVSVPEFPSGT